MNPIGSTEVQNGEAKKPLIVDVQEGETEAQARERHASGEPDAYAAAADRANLEVFQEIISNPAAATVDAPAIAAVEAAVEATAESHEEKVKRLEQLREAHEKTVKGKGKRAKASGTTVPPELAAEVTKFEKPAPTPPVVMEVRDLLVEEVQPSLFNPRKHFDATKLTELANSIRALGIQEPLKVRPINNGTYEIIFGERRWHAAKLAGFATVPCIVEEMDDADAQELRVVENIQRADLNELEEAQGYADLQNFGRSVEEISTACGKSREWVYARLKLLQLPDAGKKAVRTGKLPASTAVLVARIPDPKLRENALEEILTGGGAQYEETDSGTSAFVKHAMSYRRAAEHIEAKYMVRLKDAPFSTKDEQLVPAAGSCTNCPKRTGNMQAQFPDLKSADVCTDVPCFEQKKQAALKVKVDSIKAKGANVLPPSRSKGVLLPSHDGGVQVRPESGFMLLDDAVPTDPKKTWREVLGKDVAKTVAVDEHNKGHDLVRIDDAKKAIKEAGLKIQVPRVQQSHGPRQLSPEAEAKQAAAVHLVVRVAERARERIIQAVEKKKTTPATFLRMLAAELLKYDDFQTCARRGWTDKKQVDGNIAKADEPSLRGMLYEHTFGPQLEHRHGTSLNPDLRELMKAWGVDQVKLEKEVKAELEAAEKASQAAGKGPSSDAKTGGQGNGAPAKVKKGKAA